MKTELIFFDREEKFLEWGNQWERCCAAFGILVGFNTCYGYLNRDRLGNAITAPNCTIFQKVLLIIALVFPFVWIASAVGCTNISPDEATSAVYGALVGFVVYFSVVSALYLFCRWPLVFVLVDLFAGVAFTSFASYIAFKVKK